MAIAQLPLRSRKARQTRERILANAVAFFREQGVRRTRLSEVAEASEISPATLFNYFGTKGHLAEAWVRGEIEQTLATAAADSDARERSLRSTIRSACRVVATASAAEPSLRLEAWREAGRASGQPLPDAIYLRRALVEGLRLEQQLERIRRDLSPDDLYEMLIEAIEGGVIAGLQPVAGAASSEPTVARLNQKIRERVDLILDGARKRNERVRASRVAQESSGARGPAGP